MKLYETITAENWFHGKPGTDSAGRMCLGLRFQVVIGTDYDQARRLHEAIKILFPERYEAPTGDVSFNDHPDTTVDDVIRVCKLADV